MPSANLALRQFDLASITPEPWRNGVGLTRTLAVGPDSSESAQAGDWLWRVSVATITQDGRFSCFPGVDRSSLLLAGTELALHFANGQPVLRLRPGESASYPGDATPMARIQGAPLQCLNVMTRSGRCQAQLRSVAQTTQLAGSWLALVIRGRFSCQSLDGSYMTFMAPAQVIQAQTATSFVVISMVSDSLLAVVEISPQDAISGAAGV